MSENCFAQTQESSRQSGMNDAVALIWAVIAIPCVTGQTAPSAGFEVASVKRSPQNVDGKSGMSEDAGRINYSNVPLIAVVMRAYQTKYRQIVAPDGWAPNSMTSLRRAQRRKTFRSCFRHFWPKGSNLRHSPK